MSGQPQWENAAFTRCPIGGASNSRQPWAALRESDGFSFAPGAHAREPKADRWHYPQQKGAKMSNTKLEV